MSTSPGMMKRLRQKFDNTCHYCGLKCSNKVGHPRQATKDHVVPKFFGGANNMTNYVLACQSCNSKRGNNLFECMCIFCGPLIDAALDSQSNMDYVFRGMLNFNKPRISRVTQFHGPQDIRHDLPWRVHHGTGCKHFATYDEAVEFATGDIKIRSHNDRF